MIFFIHLIRAIGVSIAINIHILMHIEYRNRIRALALQYVIVYNFRKWANEWII